MTYKDTWNNPKSAIKTENFGVFNKKMRFFFVVSEKTTTFAAHFEKMLCEVAEKLGYGVMVTLQILVLPFLVRVRVPQQEKRSIVDFNN